MAMNLDAMLKIRADVDGQNKIVALNRGLQQVGTTAAGVTGAMRGLTGAAAGLSGALGTLAPLLSAAGLVGMVKNTIDAGDAMYDLSQSTGVSVEALARFKKAAATSGTTLEGVSKGLVKLNKAMVDAATGGKASVATFQALGISVKNADGSLKSADQVMLEVADRFKAMPDGAAKTALALRLFGKSGAELVPMLNMGGAAIDKLKVKMTAAFAERADEYSDKLTGLSGKVGALGADLTIALLPALEQITNALTVAVTAFNDLPGPIKSAAVGAAALAIAWGPLMGAMKGGAGLIAGAANGLEFFRYQATLAGGVMPMLIGYIRGLSAAILAIPGWGWALAGVTALGLLGKALYDNNSAFRNWVNNVGTIIATDFSNTMKNMVELGSAAARGVSQAWDWLVGATSDAANRIGNAFGAPFGFIANAAQRVFGSVLDAIARLWNGIPAPIRKALGQGALMAVGPMGYATGVAFRAFQMSPQQSVNRAGKTDLGGGVGFTPDLSALESGSGGGADKKGVDKAKQIRDAMLASREALAQSKAELAILRELDPIRKIELEYAEKKRVVQAQASRDLEKAQSIEEEANIQRRRFIDLQRIDLEQKNALTEKYKELGKAAYEAALNAAEFGNVMDRMRPAFAGIVEGINKWKEGVGSLREQMSQLAQGVLDTLQGSLSTAISSAITTFATGAGSIKQTLADMFKSIGDSFVKMASEIIAKQLIMAALNAALGIFGGGTGGLSGTGALASPVKGWNFAGPG
ncbi:MAG: Synechococcus phage, partial [Cyanobacteriota bacterium]